MQAVASARAAHTPIATTNAAWLIARLHCAVSGSTLQNFHDGSAQTLEAVVEDYDRARTLGLSAQQKANLVEFLKSL